jgi:hypothetical protein
MAKRKVKSKSKSKPRKRSTTMATTKRRKRRKKSTTTSVRRRLSAAPVRRRRKKRGMLSSNGSLMQSAKHNGAGAIGGGLFLGTRLVAMPLWGRTVLGYAAAVALGMFNAPFVGAGMAGATTYHLGQSLLPATMLNDDLQDTEFVDPNTLSDTGQVDENGDMIVLDEAGNAYALNDAGELCELEEGTNMESVSMLPLQDPYALNDSNPFALASNW